MYRLANCTDSIHRGLQIFSPFVNMPPRELTDYYRLIKRPISLNYVKKRTRGQHGRGAATMMTDYKNWDAFEEDVSYIWRNAREYNEDGSDMFNLAGEFEVGTRSVFFQPLKLTEI